MSEHEAFRVDTGDDEQNSWTEEQRMAYVRGDEQREKRDTYRRAAKQWRIDAARAERASDPKARLYALLATTCEQLRDAHERAAVAFDALGDEYGREATDARRCE